MFTTWDKAWIAGVVSFICTYVVQHFFGITVDPSVQGGIVAVITALLTWLVPNKQA